MAKRKRSQPKPTASIAGYVRKSKVEYPANLTSAADRAAYVETLRRVRVQELIADAARNGHVITAWYDDMDVSGTTEHSDDRVAFNRLGDDAAAGDISIIYARDLSRLFRGLIDQELWFEDMAHRGVTVHVADLPRGGDDIDSRMIRGILGAINERMARDTGRRIRRNTIAAIENGGLGSRTLPRWGTRVDPDTGKRVLDPVTADHIAFVFETFIAAQGMFGRCARLLNEAHEDGHPRAVLSPLKSGPWIGSNVRHLIDSTIWRGVISYGMTESGSYEITKPLPDDFPVVVDPVLVAEADRLIAMRHPDGRKKAGPAPQTTWGSLMRCGYCNDVIRLRRRSPGQRRESDWITYRCRRSDMSRFYCAEAKGFAQYRIDRLVKTALETALAHYASVHDLDSAAVDRAVQKRTRKAPRQDKDSLAGAIAKLESERTKYEQLYARGVIQSIDALTIHLSDVEAKRTRLLAQLADIDQSPAASAPLAPERWSKIVTGLSAWADETPDSMSRMDPAKLAYLQDLGVTVKLFAGDSPEYTSLRPRIEVSISALGYVGENAITVTESDEAATEANHERHRRDRPRNPF